MVINMSKSNSIHAIVLLLFGLTGCNSLPMKSAERINLAGEWRFAMDSGDAGVNESWWKKGLGDTIKIPGILQSQGYGNEITAETQFVAALPRDMRWYLLPQYEPYTKPGNIKVPYLSQPVRHYLGPAWYQRDLEVPESWAGKRVSLSMERPRWESRVWVDDQPVGTSNSLVAPHEFELGILSPGKHTLTVRLDNRMILPYRPDGHSVSDALGNSWNGIAGKVELRATSPVWIDDAQVFPNVEKKSALVKVKVGNATGKTGAGTVSVRGNSVPVTWDQKGGSAEVEVQLGANAKLWSEFSPVLHKVQVALKGPEADDRREVTFGLREIKADGKRLLLNGVEVNFRGTHHGGDFPLTGYPATDVNSWKRIIQICKDYGLNHIRFHSYCPPEAAFTAADELGFYLAPEAGMWNDFSRPGIPEMLHAETARMLKAYGNHPSFILFAASNEPAGRWQPVLNPWAEENYKNDPRRLWATNTGRSSSTTPGAQYASTPYRNIQGWFGRDYSRNPAIQNAIMPNIAHEVGQWCAYPDFEVINKFKGYLQGKNYEIYRESAIKNDTLELNKLWAYNSGKFQLACYKEEIEANLRTAGAAGFQLLDLHDYIGQGGALVGVLDPFWDAKSYVSAEIFRRFSGPTVPLARLLNPVMKSSDTFDVPIEIAHFGAAPLTSVRPTWKIVDRNGKTAAQGEWAPRDIAIGKNIPLGNVQVDLTKIAAPEMYKLVVGIAGTKVENDWTFWLYPAEVDVTTPANVVLTSDWNEAKAKLDAGGNVLFVPTAENLDNTSPPLNNVPFFWNRLMNPSARGEGMLGLVIDPKHPAMAQFPSDTFCHWEWSELVRNVRAVNVDKVPLKLKPIVQPIDDWSRNFRLGVIFEAKVGTGKLMVCAINLTDNLDTRIGARQLRKSLVGYMAGDTFQPQQVLTAEQASALFPGPSQDQPQRPVTPQALPGDIIQGGGARPGQQ